MKKIQEERKKLKPCIELFIGYFLMDISTILQTILLLRNFATEQKK